MMNIGWRVAQITLAAASQAGASDVDGGWFKPHQLSSNRN